MLVEEVSNVDRAANKRRFLMVKRDGENMSTQLVSDGRGGFTRISKSDETDEEKAKKAAAAEEEEEAKKAFPPGAKAPPFGAKKPGDDEGDEDDEEDKKKAKKVAARKATLSAIASCVETLMSVGEALQKADDKEEEDLPPWMKDKAKKALEDLAKNLEPLPVAKAGRRMSKERLDRFKGALESLQSILKEVINSPELPDMVEDKAAPAGKSFDKPGEAGGAGTLSQTDAELVGAISDLKDVVKRQEREIVAMRKGMGGRSNAISDPKVRTEKNTSTDEVEWPMDMNRPITRKTTKSEVSFYDDE